MKQYKIISQQVDNVSLFGKFINDALIGGWAVDGQLVVIPVPIVDRFKGPQMIFICSILLSK